MKSGKDICSSSASPALGLYAAAKVFLKSLQVIYVCAEYDLGDGKGGGPDRRR